MNYKKKTINLLFAILAVYAALVATHKGEFWPFSIYPMFSQAGNPWTRSFVRDVTNEERTIAGNIQTEDQLYGEPFALNQIGVHQNDLSNFMSKNKNWTPQKKQAVRNYFGDLLNDNSFLIYRVRGELGNHDVDISYTPFIYITPDTTIVFEQ